MQPRRAASQALLASVDRFRWPSDLDVGPMCTAGHPWARVTATSIPKRHRNVRYVDADTRDEGSESVRSREPPTTRSPHARTRLAVCPVEDREGAATPSPVFSAQLWRLTLGQLGPADQFDLFSEGRSARRFESTVLLGKAVAYGASKRTCRLTLRVQ